MGMESRLHRQAKVVWARDMGDAQNQELLQYFKSRRAWRLDADDPSPKLQPYTAALTLNPETFIVASTRVPLPWTVFMTDGTYYAGWLTPRRLRAHGLIVGVALWSVYLWTMATPGLRDRDGKSQRHRLPALLYTGPGRAGASRT